MSGARPAREPSLEQFLTNWGLIAVFAAAIVEGDVSLVLAGFVARMGFTTLPATVLIAALGLLITDTFWFGLGRWRSGWVRGTRLYARAEPTVRAVAERLGPRQIILSRFVYGTRLPTMFFWGVLGLSFTRFFLLDVFGCLLWSTLLAGAGFALSESASALVGEVKRVEIWLLTALIAGVLVLLVMRLIARRRRVSSPQPSP
ncbi:MAG: DedA family protein [Acidobacteria bacterium]|nr:DedA family protein [Acidobacteriota bacterium]